MHPDDERENGYAWTLLVLLAVAWALSAIHGCTGCELKVRPADYHVPPLAIRGTPPDHEDAGR